MVKKNIPFVLFLNKIDLFKEKLESKPQSLEALVERFPDYEEERKKFDGKKLSEYEIGIEYFKHRFDTLYNGSENLTIHHTCALDTEQCVVVFDAVVEVMTKRLMRTAGI